MTVNDEQFGQTGGASGRRVLVVEDEPSAREACERYLSLNGHTVASAASAAEALECADAFQPEVLICDWRLGGRRDGVTVARELQPRYELDVYFLTAHPLDDLRDAAQGIAVTRFLKKPVSLVELAALIDVT